MRIIACLYVSFLFIDRMRANNPFSILCTNTLQLTGGTDTWCRRMQSRSGEIFVEIYSDGFILNSFLSSIYASKLLLFDCALCQKTDGGSFYSLIHLNLV